METSEVFTTRREAEALMERLGGDIEEKQLDPIVRDIHTCILLVDDGIPRVSSRSSHPGNIITHPGSVWAKGQGATGHGFTPEDAEAAARAALEKGE